MKNQLDGQAALYDNSPAADAAGAMLDINALLADVARQAKSIGIPISEHIHPKVQINTRAKGRFGACTKKRDGTFVIELSDKMLTAPPLSCRQTLAHELLHTCYGCQNHKKRWHAYAQKMNDAFGYHISRTDTPEALGVVINTPSRYIVFCENCAMEFPRNRRSSLVAYPEHYRCPRCGGTLHLR